MSRSTTSPTTRWLSRATGRREDSGAAMMLVISCLLLAAMLTVALLGVLTSELRPTVYERKSARTIAAAEAGLQAGLSILRTASGNAAGDFTKLPCTPITGQVGGGSTTLAYDLTISYYSTDPSVGARTPVACPLAAASTARYALIASKAHEAVLGEGDRGQEAVYKLSVTDPHVLAGRVLVSLFDSTVPPPPAAQYCWEAGSATVGASLTLQVCDSVAQTNPRQWFAYRSDYSLVLSSTPTLCVSATDSRLVTLQTCGPDPLQQWSFSGFNYGQFQRSLADGSGLDGNVCLDSWLAGAQSHALGATITTFGCGDPDPAAVPAKTVARAWAPDPSAGPGAAGEAKGQLVNYSQFGRCLDVPRYDYDYNYVPPGHGFLQPYPCKQNPFGDVDINEKWTLPSAPQQQISINSPAPWQTSPTRVPALTQYCLTTSATPGGRVLVQSCAAAAGKNWTINRATGTRSTAYTILDNAGLCLSVGPPPIDQGLPNTDFYTGDAKSAGHVHWSTIIVEACDGSDRQKWNAPAEVLLSAVLDQRETTRD